MNKVNTISLETGDMSLEKPELKAVATALTQKFNLWQDDRQTKEERWLELWAHYMSTEEAQLHLRQRVGQVVGNVNDDWRHRIMTGKAYSIVETAVAYLAGATFPNDMYLNVEPEEPGIRQEARAMRRWMLDKLGQANLPSKWEMHLRQQLITGFSCIALPWVVTKEKRKKRVLKQKEDSLGSMDYWAMQEYERTTYNNAKLEVLSCFDVYIDPYCADANEASLFRILHKNMGDIVKGYHNGTYNLLPITELLASSKSATRQKGTSVTKQESYKRDVACFAGLDYDPLEKVQMQEYWGDLQVGDNIYENVCISIINGKVARFEPMPYWCGKPFIVGVPIPIPTLPYGMGILEPVRGMLHENNILTNQRLDGQEILIDPTFLLVPDNVTDPDSVYTAPGHFIEVQDLNSVRQLQTNPNNLSITYTEQNVLNANIDEATGISAYVGTQAGRNAERVTAAEVNAVKEAGGNRLSSIHTHIEHTQFLPFLDKWLYLAKQFVMEDQRIKMPGQDQGETDYVEFGPDVINHDYSLKVVGADFLAKQEKAIADILAFVDTVVSVPAWEQMLNWEELLVVVTEKFNLSSDVEKLIIRGIKQKQEAEAQAAEQEEAMLPSDPFQDEMNQAIQSQGMAGAQNLAAMAQQLGPEAAITARQGNMMGLPPEQIEAAMAQQTPIQ